ncbi:hypothetical protein RHMOL_Rhmol07G0288200 [Rhododendron molle]|uniref:Uncharacterized protein n=1 Tax=Rhododendron molle TaxID=49168 RepID=A0ACC0N7B8_RHOML|nr:hypothetical protein RHMOL_Rhmol07G0288200 [Rhododendron molle]
MKTTSKEQVRGAKLKMYMIHNNHMFFVGIGAGTGQPVPNHSSRGSTRYDVGRFIPSDPVEQPLRIMPPEDYVNSVGDLPHNPPVALASAEGPFLEQVRGAQLGLDHANVKFVDAQGLELEPDNLHLTTRAEVQLSMMLADSFLQTRSSPP